MATYFTSYQQALKAGNATEHTQRPALKALIESVSSQIMATNEPKRTACGAPDYSVTREGSTIGYIEAKDVGKLLLRRRAAGSAGVLYRRLPTSAKMVERPARTSSRMMI